MSAREWESRLGWARGVVADDPVRREAAYETLQSRNEVRSSALRRFNASWAVDKGSWSEATYALAREHAATSRETLPDGLWHGIGDGDLAVWPGLEFVLVFREWEARYPQEWTWHAKAWGTKQRLLRRLTAAVPGLPSWARAKLVWLVLAAVSRVQRVGDDEYVRLGRRLGGELVPHLEPLRKHTEAHVRRRAGYLLWTIADPRLPHPKVEQWRSYLRDVHGVTEHSAPRLKRFVDFACDALVRCPLCDAKAQVLAGDDRLWRLTCVCGNSELKRPDFYSYHGVTDPVFRYPLWLQERCCGGEVLWAYNVEHLTVMQRFVQARSGYADVPTNIGFAPWMRASRHRDEILAVIAGMLSR